MPAKHIALMVAVLAICAAIGYASLTAILGTLVSTPEASPAPVAAPSVAMAPAEPRRVPAEDSLSRVRRTDLLATLTDRLGGASPADAAKEYGAYTINAPGQVGFLFDIASEKDWHCPSADKLTRIALRVEEGRNEMGCWQPLPDGGARVRWLDESRARQYAATELGKASGHK